MKIHVTLYGFLIFMLGFFLLLLSFLVLLFGSVFFSNSEFFQSFGQTAIWLVGWLLFVGLGMVLFELLYLKRHSEREVRNDVIDQDTQLTVGLTAYNDELSIADAVRDFKSHPNVKRVIVISNNSQDSTLERAQAAGAIAYNEKRQGYGACVHRTLSEAVKYKDTEYSILCEGDCTFRAHDIGKLLSYIPHADIVNGTRIVQQLREQMTQLTTFMYYGNFFCGKLLEMKHIEKGTLTDVGTTYKLCRNSALKKVLPLVKPTVNLEFNPYFLDTSLSNGLTIVECPITFYKRKGVSKGGNLNNQVAFRLGMRMIYGIIFGWKRYE